MAEQILTQVEVDALLKGLSNGDIKTEAKKEDVSKSTRTYDFTNQERPVRGRMPALELLNVRFARNVRTAIFGLMRKTVDVTHDGVKTMRYEEFLKNLQVPSSLNIFQMNPLRGSGILVVDPTLVFIIVDNYFGGDGSYHTRIEGRDFSIVEQSVIKKVVDVIFAEMKEVWKPVYPLDFKFVKSEMNPQFVNVISGSEYVITSSFKMEIETASSKFFFCIPYSALEPIQPKLFGTERPEAGDSDRRWGATLLDQFNAVDVAVSCEIGRAHINVSELLNLKAGDIIQLDKKIKDPVDVFIEGVPKLAARPGLLDNNYALKIVSRTQERG